jgi:glucose/arabinose dehydrogenase
VVANYSLPKRVATNPFAKPVSDPPLGNKYPLNLYYAYGIRNSFGIAFDPVNGKL